MLASLNRKNGSMLASQLVIQKLKFFKYENFQFYHSLNAGHDIQASYKHQVRKITDGNKLNIVIKQLSIQVRLGVI